MEHSSASTVIYITSQRFKWTWLASLFRSSQMYLLVLMQNITLSQVGAQKWWRKQVVCKLGIVFHHHSHPGINISGNTGGTKFVYAGNKVRISGNTGGTKFVHAGNKVRISGNTGGTKFVHAGNKVRISGNTGGTKFVHAWITRLRVEK